MDSDIFVVDVATGDITNLTPEESGVVGESWHNLDRSAVDISPAWVDYDTILFARHTNLFDEVPQFELSQVSISDGEVESFFDLKALGVQSVDSKIWRLSSGDLCFPVSYLEGENSREILMVSADGESTALHPGVLEHFVIDTVNETHLIARDMAALTSWYVPLDNQEEPVPL